MSDFIVGTITLIVALVILASMGVYFMKVAGPTTSAWLNTYTLLRRGGWKVLPAGLAILAIAYAIGLVLFAL